MICAIILAAGQSRRMGASKLLLPFGDRTVIARVVAAIPRGPVGRIFVVIRAGDSAIPNALAGQALDFVTNPDPEGDMLSSVRCGFRALPAQCEAALIVLGDQPGVTPALIETLLAARGSSGCSLIVPRGPAGRGHPLLVGMEHRDEVLTCFDGVGLHGLLDAHPTSVLEAAATGAMALSDLDTPADYARLKAHFLSEDSSGPHESHHHHGAGCQGAPLADEEAAGASNPLSLPGMPAVSSAPAYAPDEPVVVLEKPPKA